MLYDPQKWVMPEVPVRESEVVELLKEGRRRIIEEGWWQCTGPDRKAGYCTLLAITHQGTHNDFLCGKFDRALSYLKRSTGAAFLPDWNDAPERTLVEVIAGYDRAIELARADA